jgi:hypothetical protein
VRLPLDEAYLLCRERRAARCDYILYTCLHQRYDIGVALDEQALILLADVISRLVDAVEYLTFSIDIALAGIDILRRFFIFDHDTPAKGDDLALHTMYGKHHAIAKEVIFRIFL